MKKIFAATLLFVATASAALAACPVGTRYDCQTMPNGKQSCGCR